MIKIIKKPEPNRKKEIGMRILAAICALAAAAVVMAIMGYNPFEVYAKIVESSFKNTRRFQSTMNTAIPLLVLSLGVAVAFKMKFWNIGAEGQLYMGAFGASFVALNFSNLSAPLLLILMMVAGIICGGLWALIPALLKVRFSTSETLVTLMLNYIAIQWISYLQYGPWKDPKALGAAKIPNFVDAAILPKVFGVHIGWIIALVLVVVVHILLNYSKLGYEISVLGESDTTAKYAGMNVAKITIMAILISGGICGIAGMMQASAVEKTLSDQLSGGMGFTAVITSWLAQLNAPVTVVVSFLFAMLLKSGSYLQTTMNIPANVSDVIQGVIIFFVLGSEFFIQYKVVFQKKAPDKAVKKEAEKI